MRGGLWVLLLAAVIAAGSASALPVPPLHESDLALNWSDPFTLRPAPESYFNPGVSTRIVYGEYLAAEPISSSVIPEPTALLLLAFSLAGLAISRQLLR